MAGDTDIQMALVCEKVFIKTCAVEKNRGSGRVMGRKTDTSPETGDRQTDKQIKLSEQHKSR